MHQKHPPAKVAVARPSAARAAAPHSQAAATKTRLTKPRGDRRCMSASYHLPLSHVAISDAALRPHGEGTWWLLDLNSLTCDQVSSDSSISSANPLASLWLRPLPTLWRSMATA